MIDQGYCSLECLTIMARSNFNIIRELFIRSENKFPQPTLCRSYVVGCSEINKAPDSRCAFIFPVMMFDTEHRIGTLITQRADV